MRQDRNALRPFIDSNRFSKYKGQHSTAPGPEKILGKAGGTTRLDLPRWSTHEYGAPNAIIRSALFGVGTGRVYLSSEPIAALAGIEIKCTGESLNQDDFDVWQALIHYTLIENLTCECTVSAYALMAMLDLTDTGKNRKTLRARLLRLRAMTVEIKTGDTHYLGGLIDEAYQVKDGPWNIRINHSMLRLFGPCQFTKLNKHVRRALSGKPLAQWLHAFYSSHRNPFSYKVENLYALCRSRTARISDFKKDLIKSLELVKEAARKHGLIFDYQVTDGVVQVCKNFSKRRSRKAPIEAGRTGTSNVAIFAN